VASEGCIGIYIQTRNYGPTAAFAPDRPVEFAKPFTPEHWSMLEGVLLDPDGRHVSLQAPLPPGTDGPDADAHHAEKYN
jgi:hypothetical protein